MKFIVSEINRKILKITDLNVGDIFVYSKNVVYVVVKNQGRFITAVRVAYYDKRDKEYNMETSPCNFYNKDVYQITGLYRSPKLIRHKNTPPDNCQVGTIKAKRTTNKKN